MDIVDLRSDTVTQPTPDMRAAMAAAEVGDDVFREDPNINRLQEMAAERMGKAAGLFVPSGTMGNLAAVLAHCGRGDEVILGNLGHTFLFEGGGIAALGGVHSYVLPNQPDGTLLLEEIREAIGYGVIKMNIDTDMQFAFTEGVRDYMINNLEYLKTQIGNPEGEELPNKKYYDPRKWLRDGEITFKKRLEQAFKDLNNVNTL